MSGESYSAIAHVYDKLNADIDYEAWADFFEDCFLRYLDKKPEIVLDLASGTGSMTLTLAKRGYDMIGVDASADMLNVAYERSAGTEGVLYLLQDMREFELYGTVGAITCCLDSINYLVDDGDLDRCFACAHNYLDPDGLFLFDVNTPYKFREVYGNNAYILEDVVDGNQIFCGWQNDFDEESGLCGFYLSVFEEHNGKYQRLDEEQTERMFEREYLVEHLRENGFEVLGVFGDFDFSEPDNECERWYFVARCKK